MEYIKIGKIVNTHGIKGEIRIISNFDKKNIIFKPNFKLYIGIEKIEEIIKTYRRHKEFDMVTFNGYDNINQILKYLKQDVYINREDLSLTKEEYIDNDLIGMQVYTDHIIGTVKEIIKNKQDIIVIYGKKEFLIPKVDAFIKKVDLDNKIIYINEIEGLIDEN